MRFRAGDFRVINTHLEGFHPQVQLAQASQLLEGPANTPLPVLSVGDFNSKADGIGTPTYHLLLASGFVDAWSATPHPGPGYTCCQDPDLLNPQSALSERIDLLLLKGATFTPVMTMVVGDKPQDKTPSGLWAADHAAVFGVFLLR